MAGHSPAIMGVTKMSLKVLHSSCHHCVSATISPGWIVSVPSHVGPGSHAPTGRRALSKSGVKACPNPETLILRPAGVGQPPSLHRACIYPHMQPYDSHLWSHSLVAPGYKLNFLAPHKAGSCALTADRDPALRLRRSSPCALSLDRLRRKQI